MVRVLTVDDHPPFRDAARAVIAATPGLDGLETCRRLTASAPAPLVVLISADDDPGVRESVHEHGAAGFVAKQELRPGILLALWNRRHAAAITPPG